MKVIVGLGNPGEKYEKTRHNLGFHVLDALLEKLEPLDKTFWEDNKKLKSLVKLIKTNRQHPTANTEELILIKPNTFMNDSGIAVRKVIDFYKIDPEDVFVIHDELDMPFGKIRVRFGGGPGGHNGIKSLIEHIGDKFLRIRLGIGTDGNNKLRQEHTDRYVLGVISSRERGKVKTMTNEAIKTVELLLEHGIEKYMSKYNK